MHDWGPAELTLASGAARREDEGSDARAPRRARRAGLAELIKTEILPHLAAARHHAATPSPDVVAADPEALARLLLRGDTGQARAQLAARIASGASAQSLMLEDIACAARRLGAAWSADDCDFLDVTAATHSLFVLMREFAPLDKTSPARAPALLVAPAPGETHTLGADVVVGLFRCAGWRASRCEAAKLPAALAREWSDAAGFSVSCDRYLPDLAQTIAKARVSARNPRLKVIVGGPVFANRIELAQGLGADFVAADGDVAARLPHALRKMLQL